MEKLLENLSEHFGYAAPFMYAAAAYYFFRWLDENASDEAKAALARTMTFKDYKNEQVASALVEVFDGIYTYPLLRWRAFFRSLLFTTVVSAIYVFEAGRSEIALSAWLLAFLFNVFTDYLSLFVIRPLLVRSGTKPVIGLALGAVSGAAIVLAANHLRQESLSSVANYYVKLHDLGVIVEWGLLVGPLFYAWPAMFVFVWLPLLALGILIARLLTPLSWTVARAQWFLKEGKEHPLNAIGYVAAFVVFLGTVAGRAVFNA
jgi:hypothetical protein